MLNSIVKLGMMLALSMLVLFSCSDEASLSDPDVYTDEAMFSLQKDGNTGHYGCFELVFPLTIEFPNGNTRTIDNYEELRHAIRAWRVNHPNVDGRPHFVFPIEVISEDGDVILVNSFQALRTLGGDCPRDFFHRHDRPGHSDRPMRCFDIVFPITIEFQDGTTVTVQNRQELKQAIRQWHTNHPDATVRPHLTFPFDVELENGNVVTIDDRQELHRLKDSCAGD